MPVGYLILSGAGLNAYVCFPSVFGITLFLLYPWKTSGRLSSKVTGFMTVLTLWCCGQVLLDGYHCHRVGQPERPRPAMDMRWLP